MNLSGLSNSQIEQAIAKMQKGIEIKPNSPESAELQISIDRALDELKRRGQKKRTRGTRTLKRNSSNGGGNARVGKKKNHCKARNKATLNGY